MILMKLLILISVILFLFVERSQQRVVFERIVNYLQRLRRSKLALVLRERLTNFIRNLFFDIFNLSRGLRLKRYGGQWSYNYDYDFWGKLEKGDFE